MRWSQCCAPKGAWAGVSFVGGHPRASDQRVISFTPFVFSETLFFARRIKDSRKRVFFIYHFVIPAKAGIQNQAFLDSRFPIETFGNDKRK
jgi:hypothetical protein